MKTGLMKITTVTTAMVLGPVKAEVPRPGRSRKKAREADSWKELLPEAQPAFSLSAMQTGGSIPAGHGVSYAGPKGLWWAIEFALT